MLIRLQAAGNTVFEALLEGEHDPSVIVRNGRYFGYTGIAGDLARTYSERQVWDLHDSDIALIYKNEIAAPEPRVPDPNALALMQAIEFQKIVAAKIVDLQERIVVLLERAPPDDGGCADPVADEPAAPDLGDLTWPGEGFHPSDYGGGDALPPGGWTRTTRPQPTHVSTREGGAWYALHPEAPRSAFHAVHAVKFEDGSVWDCVNGWRNESGAARGPS